MTRTTNGSYLGIYTLGDEKEKEADKSDHENKR